MSNDRITSDHYGARRAGQGQAYTSGSLTPTAAARPGVNMRGGVQFSARHPHKPAPDVSGAPVMRSNHYGGRTMHAAPVVAAEPVDLDETFGSDDDLNAEIDELLEDDD